MSKGKRIERHKALAIAAELRERLTNANTSIIVGGSIRRGKATVGDIDLVAVCGNQKATDTLNDTLGELFGYCKKKPQRAKRFGSWLAYVEMNGNSYYQDVGINVFDCNPQEVGAALLFCTGSGTFNIKMRSIAKRRGLLLNRYGLFNRDDVRENVCPATDEESIFSALRIPFFQPVQRTECALAW